MTDHPRSSSASARSPEWPTWGLIGVIYGGWLALTLLFDRLPLWAAGPAAAWLCAWHGSLQHEITHGHPTGNRRLDALLGFPPLTLWLPFERYRDLHLAHHSDEEVLTYPAFDTESYYVTAEDWRRRSALGRAVTRARNTLAGRVLLNPLLVVPSFLSHEANAVLRNIPGRRRLWAFHGLGVIVLLYWVLAICRVPLWAYLLFFVYGGAALSSVRSFAEHRAAARPEHRTAIVEKTPLFGLLFLFNNLHVVHHRAPGMPWYRIPSFYRAHRDTLIAANGGLVYRGYADVARRFLFREHDAPLNDWAAAIVGASLLALSAAGAVAQTADDQDQIPNIVVTAQRQGAQDIQQVPLAITALDAGKLDALNLQSYSDYLRLVPSVSVQEEGPGVNSIVIRGLATRGLSMSEVEDRSLVAVYIDDTPVTLQSANPDLKVLDLERVEVLRGPQGTLYGAGAMAGTVRQITAKPNLTDFFGDVELVGSATSGNGGYNGDVRGTVNIPLVTDKVALRAAAYSGTESGYIRNVALGDKGDNGETSHQARVALRVVPSDRLTIDLSTIYAHDYGGLNDAYTGLGSYTFTSLSPERSGDITSISNLTIDYDFGAAHLVSSSSALIRKTFYGQSADFTVNDFVFGGKGALNAADYTIANKVYDYTEEARLASSGSGPLRWTAGVFYETATRKFREDEPVAGFDARLGAQNGFPGYNSQVNDGAFNPDDLFSGTQNTRDTQTALFAEATYAIGDVDVTAGLRYFDWSESYDLAFSGYFGNIVDTSPANPYGSVPETTSSTANATGVNPKFAADYHLDDDVLLFAEAAKGFRYGGNNQPVPLGICGGALKAEGLSAAPQNFGPDSLWSYSVGEKGTFLGNRLKANLTGYIVNWYDTQTVNTLSCSYYFTENGGKVRSRGAELELEGVLLPGWTAGLDGSYTDAVTVGPIANLNAADGARAPYSPRYIVNLKTDYSRTLADGTLTVSAVWSFKGNSTNSFTPSSASYRVIPASDSLSAAITYHIGRWEYGVFGDNLTNGTRIVDYDRYPSLAGSQEPGDRVYYARPLTVGLRSKVSF